MKNIIILILFFVCFIQMLAQNTEPTTHPFHYKISNSQSIDVQPNSNDTLFKQKRMHLGWQWGEDIEDNLHETRNRDKM